MVLARCPTTSESTSCTASSDIEGQPASVTCFFPEDLTVHRHHFRITKFDFDRLWSLPGTFACHHNVVFTCFSFELPVMSIKVQLLCSVGNGATKSSYKEDRADLGGGRGWHWWWW